MMAASTLSLGMLTARAFWIARRKAGLLSGFGPPARTAMAMSHKRTRREYCGGEAPYGWRIDGAHLVPHDAEQTVMRCARELREAGLSLRKIGVELEVRGMLPRCGLKWHAVTVRSLVNGDLETRSPETQEGVA